MKLRNLAIVFCAASALLAACGSSDDSGSVASGGGGAGGKSTGGAAGKGGGAGRGGGAGLESAGTGGEAGSVEAAGAGGAIGEGGAGGAAVVVDTFTVTLENVAPTKLFTSSGVFNTPVGDLSAGAATPGKTYKFTVDAGRKQKLFFATMLAATNDLFFAPSGDGIPLYLDNGTPITADVTSQVYLWDAGTELNEEPFLGPNTVTKQAAPNTGPVDTNTNVRKIGDVTEGFIFAYPAVASMLKVTVTHTTGTLFDITIDDLVGAALTTSDAVVHPLPISPGVWAMSGTERQLRCSTAGMAAPAHRSRISRRRRQPRDAGHVRRDDLGHHVPCLARRVATPPNRQQAVVHLWRARLRQRASKPMPKMATRGAAGRKPLVSRRLHHWRHLFNTPVGAVAPGPILPGSQYSFTFDASPGDSLSFASMLAATNDVFFAPQDTGIALFDANDVPTTGDVSSQIYLWDAGTEGNEEPGIGPNTVTNQLAPNTGSPGEGKVQLLSAVTTDTYSYPSAQSVLKVTISAK